MSPNLLINKVNTRRDFIKLSVLAGFALGLPKKSEAIIKRLLPKSIIDMSPIQALNIDQYRGRAQ